MVHEEVKVPESVSSEKVFLEYEEYLKEFQPLSKEEYLTRERDFWKKIVIVLTWVLITTSVLRVLFGSE